MMILRITKTGIIRNKAGEVSELALPLVITSDATSETATCTTRESLATFLHSHNGQARCFLPGEIERLISDYIPAKIARGPCVRTPRKRNRNHDWMIFAG